MEKVGRWGRGWGGTAPKKRGKNVTVIYFRKHYSHYVIYKKSNVNYLCNYSHCSPNVSSFPWMLSIVICKWTWKKGTMPAKVTLYSIRLVIKHPHMFPMHEDYALHRTCWLCTMDVHSVCSLPISPLLYRHGFFCLTHSFSSSLKPLPKQSRQSWQCCRGSC